MTTLPGGRIQNGRRADILIGNVNFRAVGAQTKLFRIGAGGNFAQEFLLRGVHQADAIGGLVGRRLVVIVGLVLQQNGIAVGVEFRRRFNGRAAQGDINRPAVRAGMDAARTFADGNGGDDLEIRRR